MSFHKDIYRYPITSTLLYVTLLLGLVSIGNTSISFKNQIIQFIYRLFINTDTFSYFVVMVLLYSFKKIEYFVGSYAYMSILFTMTIMLIPIKIALSYLLVPPSGCIGYLSALLVLFWRIIPSVKSTSIPFYKSFRVSEHILLLILTILLVCKNALAGIVESCIGILIGRVLYSYLLPRDLLVRFPTWITRALIGLHHLFFGEQSSGNGSSDSATPFFAGRVPPPHLVNPMGPMGPMDGMDVQILNPTDVRNLMNLGFSRMECEFALRSCGNDINEAAEKLLSSV